jgi:chaperone required for assembly of F1-ATPase
MKRFYRCAEVREGAGGFSILLDGRPVRTPARELLELPTRRLADAVAAEWNRQEERIDPRSMSLAGLANAALDRVAPDPSAFARSLAAFGESDLLCYRADGPEALVARQSTHWDPLLGWARQRFDVDFEIVTGIIHRPQPQHTVAQLRKAVEARSIFELAGLSPLVTIGGSLVIALALAEGAIDLESGWQAATLDDAWQLEQWGEDVEAVRALAARREEFAAAYGFLGLL